jgi:small RNA 2'-O-methyltransferase
MQPGTFRHDDHKFEWTRQEFEEWCQHICTRFPDYCVQFHGVGKPPEGQEQLGSCSQLGLFIRKDFLESLDTQTEDKIEEIIEKPAIVECDDYKLIHSVAYPFFHDTRQRHEKIFDECSYHLNRFRWMEERYFNYDADRFEIPLNHVANSCWEITDNIEEIRSVIKDKFQLENDFVIFPPNESDHETEDDEEEFAPESS